MGSWTVDRGWTVKFDFQEHRSHDSLQTRPMCCPEPDDVPFIFECVGCCQLTELNDFLVVFSALCYYRPSAITPTVAPYVALLADDTGRS